MRMVFLKPVEGGLLRDPITKTPLPEAGGFVPYNNYWRRAVIEGSAVIVEQKVVAPESIASATPDNKTSRRGG